MGCGQEEKQNFYASYLGNIKHDDFTYSFDFKCKDIINWQEGDHAMLIVTIDDSLVGKKLSFVTLPDEELIRFTTRIGETPSDFKRALLNLEKGEFIKISEPSGTFRLRRENRPVVLLSNGVGISVMRTLVRRYVKSQNMVTEILQINVDARSNIFKEEFQQYQKEIPTFKSYYIEHRKSYYSFLYHELNMLYKRHELSPIIYLAGSDGFVEENTNYLKDLDMPEDDIIIGGKQKDACCRD